VSSRTLAILGSTGSIGTQALAVAARHPDRLRVVALAARRDLARLCEQAQRIGPAAVALEEPADGADARAALEAAAPAARLWIGPGAAARMIEEIDAATVLNGIVGAAGLSASMATLARGERLALANKETLVVGGELVARALERGGELLPVDSEHSAVLQCIGGRPPDEVESLTLTASGGALRSHPDWRRATPEEVLAHPVWAMGPRITVDSALLFNKGLELIEARWLFGVPWERLAATLHPQALVHAIVTFRDGSSVLQAAWPDMALPIQLALSWPERWSGSLEPLPPARLAGLEFAPIETGRYPAFDLAVAAGRAGGTAPCVLNAADEVAVEAYLGRAIELGALPGVVAAVLESHPVERVESLEQLARVDEWARGRAREEVMAHR
jgi:1-deoxy-D-xylulose-5-phosphate reductoisomerase